MVLKRFTTFLTLIKSSALENRNFISSNFYLIDFTWLNNNATTMLIIQITKIANVKTSFINIENIPKTKQTRPPINSILPTLLAKESSNLPFFLSLSKLLIKLYFCLTQIAYILRIISKYLSL